MQLNAERVLLSDKIFAEMGLHSGWELADKMYMGLGFVLENRKLIESTFPKRLVIADRKSRMWEHLQSPDRRTNLLSLLAFARRLARSRHFAIVGKKKNMRGRMECGSRKSYTIYSYKLLKS